MRLLRVQVPEFRALKDVDISFEPEFTPQVFPLGSLNGGGKSTLLQLIFVLLHKFWGVNESNKDFLENIASGLIAPNDGFKFLAKIEILTKHRKLFLEYIYGNEDSIEKYKTEKLDHLLKKHNKNDCSIYQDINYRVNNIFFYFCYSYDKPISHLENKLFEEIASEMRNNIFLISSSNQPYIFLSRQERRLLFTPDYKSTYEQSLQVLKSKLSNFYTYDFINQLKDIFISAAKYDLEMRIDTGNWGEKVDQLIATINSFFVDGKKIINFTIEQRKKPSELITEIKFTHPYGQNIYFEDLSHGELKRLAIFVLIKYHEIQDSIVLFDEIENGFHPDWQRHIVDDLVEWGASNQYILATHSYELCRGVTPAHVIDLDPKLPY